VVLVRTDAVGPRSADWPASAELDVAKPRSNNNDVAAACGTIMGADSGEDHDSIAKL